jgi:NAD(P)-dependent dehydrogenase (short-subunit alcohol dehydrogenase family)
MLAKVPLSRWAQPGDIAALVAFLVSNDAQYLTGGAYKVDGGSVVS